MLEGPPGAKAPAPPAWQGTGTGPLVGTPLEELPGLEVPAQDSGTAHSLRPTEATWTAFGQQDGPARPSSQGNLGSGTSGVQNLPPSPGALYWGAGGRAAAAGAPPAVPEHRVGEWVGVTSRGFLDWAKPFWVVAFFHEIQEHRKRGCCRERGRRTYDFTPQESRQSHSLFMHHLQKHLDFCSPFTRKHFVRSLDKGAPLRSSPTPEYPSLFAPDRDPIAVSEARCMHANIYYMIFTLSLSLYIYIHIIVYNTHYISYV